MSAASAPPRARKVGGFRLTTTAIVWLSLLGIVVVSAVLVGAQGGNLLTSGNVVDLCPVGSLTSKPYAYEARPWELRRTLTIDVMAAVDTNIRLDSRGRQVLRCVPRVNEDVNEEWAHDKTRYAIDGLVRRRLDRPFVRRDGRLVDDFVVHRTERAIHVRNAPSPAATSSLALAGLMMLLEYRRRAPAAAQGAPGLASETRDASPQTPAAARKAAWSARREKLWMNAVVVTSFLFIFLSTAEFI